jgi:hypothetical protein
MSNETDEPRKGQTGADRDTGIETTDEGLLEDEAFRSVDGAYSDEPENPAFRAVIEAGGGVAEGFEQSEAMLVDNASEGELAGWHQVLRDQGRPEPDPERAVYGEADHETDEEEPSGDEG